ncbi:MAG: DUF4956 domain-containing protein [Gemmatimonadetes bacterium]|nr:DUF4956 domain-containing protein [Gemmatimonadota bacterium]
MKDASAPRAGRTRLLRVLGYYVVLAGALLLLLRAVPEVRQALGGEGLQRLAAANPFGDAAPAVGKVVERTPGQEAILGILSMLGALLVMLPVTWVYMLTRQRRGHEEALVHSLLILPVAVTGIVMIVQYSVALAFSLAGIVAAVRFRTTLEDTKDAVYVFLAIGVGIACGAQSIGLAFVLSVIFNAVVLAIWATRFGNPYVAATAGGGRLGLGEAQAGTGSGATRRLVGDPALLEAASPRDIAQALDRAARLESHLEAERGKKKSKQSNALLLVAAGDVAGAQAGVEPILEEATAHWKLAEVVQVPGGGWVLEYLARVERGGEGSLLERVRAAATSITGVELRSLRGLKGPA